MHQCHFRFVRSACLAMYASTLGVASAAQVEAPVDAERPVDAPPYAPDTAAPDTAEGEGPGPAIDEPLPAEDTSDEAESADDEQAMDPEVSTEAGPKPEGPSSAAPPEPAPPSEPVAPTRAVPDAPPPPRQLQDRYGPFQSPQNYALELRIGPYRPDVDSYAGAPDPGPAEQFFGRRRRLYVGAEFDWQILRIPYTGTAGVGIGVGYSRANGANMIPPGTEPDAEIDQRSTFHLLPTYAVAVVRMDELTRRFPVPFVPYAKFGLGYALWWVNDGDGTARTDAGETGRGTSLGTQAALGMMLQLDIFEPSAAKALDSGSGVNHSYLFIEWSKSSLGTSDQMQLGASTWVTGLALEM